MINMTEQEIMKNWGVTNSDTPLVSVQCITYNHENYIAQALDGFLMQKTNFPFEVIVHDDASPDRTAGIVREYEKKYPAIIKAIYQTENQYSKRDGTIERIMNEACKGKYIAFCEGDDYWIDENKLQMQVDFLEENPEYGMCYTKAKEYIQSNHKFNKRVIGSCFDGFEDLLKNGNRIPTLTSVYRKDLLDKYQKDIQPSDKSWLMGDYPMWLYFSHESKVKFIDEATAVYRILENSASHSVDFKKRLAFFEGYLEIKKYFSTKYSVNYFHERDFFYFYIRDYYKYYSVDTAKMSKEYCCYIKKNIKDFIYLFGTENRLFYFFVRLLLKLKANYF